VTPHPTDIVWLVYDRQTGKGPLPPGLRGELGVYVSARSSDEAKNIGWRALNRLGVPVADVRHHRPMRGLHPVEGDAPARVLTVGEVSALGLDVRRVWPEPLTSPR
jgi:hypothetical protein